MRGDRLSLVDTRVALVVVVEVFLSAVAVADETNM